MKRNINYLLLLLFLISSCSTEEIAPPAALIEIDCELSEIRGSYVQNTDMATSNQYVLALTSPANGSAVISAKEVNGIYITEQSVTLTQESQLLIPIQGRPVELGEYALKISFTMNGKSYYCSQVFEVFEDLNPDAPITIDIVSTPIKGMMSETEIPFTVDPPGASIVVKSPVQGLVVQTTIDRRTGSGVLKLIPSESFIEGELVLSITYGLRQEITQSIDLNAFGQGMGTPDSPYIISSESLLRKIRHGVNKSFRLSNDIALVQAWIPAGTTAQPFTGTLDGKNFTISNLHFTIQDHAALIAYTGPGSVIRDLTVSGQVEGAEYVAGLVAHHLGGTITNCNASDMTIKGVNYLGSLVAHQGEGSITASTPAQALTINSFPTLFSGLGSDAKAFDIAPSTAEITLDQKPENVIVEIIDNQIRFTAMAGFTNGTVEATIRLGKVSTTRTINLFAEEQFADGDGTAANPYRVANASQFSRMREFAGAHFRLIENINLEDLETWTPIETFSGTLDGNGKSLLNLKNPNITTKGAVVLTNTGTIKNLIISDIDIATATAFGVVAGDNSGTIENIVVTGTLTSTNTADLLGGIAAEMSAGIITNCYVDLQLTASCGMVGGILGRAKSAASVVSFCTVKGDFNITGSKSRIGGVVGRAEAAVLITNCYSEVNINSIAEGVNGVGGIFGADNGAAMRIEECMFTGTIVASSNVGGIAGVGPNVKNCLVEGAGAANTASTLRSTGAPNPGALGGIAGINKGLLTHSIARNMTLRGVGSQGAKVAGIASVYQNNGYVANSVVVNTSIESGMVQRVSGSLPAAPSALTNNYASDIQVTLTEEVFSPLSDKDGLDGETVESSNLTQSFYQSLGFDFTNIWKWENDQPSLRNVGYKGNLLKK